MNHLQDQRDRIKEGKNIITHYVTNGKKLLHVRIQFKTLAREYRPVAAIASLLLLRTYVSLLCNLYYRVH